MSYPLPSLAQKYAPEQAVLNDLVQIARLSDSERAAISDRAADLVRRIRSEAKPSLMEHFLAEYGLSTREGVALMCLAEAMLRVPDAHTMDALIEDKIAPSDWGKHLGEASSSMVNASTWALMLTGRVLEEQKPGLAGVLRGAVKRLGEPIIRSAVARAMKEMGRQFVLAEDIRGALSNAEKQEAQGYTYSYDMLGEAALTAADAARYAASYEDAINAIASACTNGSVQENPGISIKLSALHPRYEYSQRDRVLRELVPTVLHLARLAKAANMGLNIDAEEQDRLVLSLEVIEAVVSHDDLSGWDGFGVVVQAYGKRASHTLDWLYALAQRLDRRIMVRLVKGAYWDTEMKHAQVEGLPDFTLFTSKTATDVSYIANARKLFEYADRIYPQFATHNAHSVAAILDMAGDRAFEFQRLHGMGERLHDIVLKDTRGRCRIYAPVGAHRDLLAYLVRRLLENGANSSFVHQIVDEDVAPEAIAVDPFAGLALAQAPSGLQHPSRIFGARDNSQGFDLAEAEAVTDVTAGRGASIPDAQALTVTKASGTQVAVTNPLTKQEIATVTELDDASARQAVGDARVWAASVEERANVLRKAADLYEANAADLFNVLAVEAGKTLPDAVGELREAVDFLRYYADQALEHSGKARGVIAAISPWNFPLAIFTGQIAAALAAGNAVVAKPAESTPVIATMAVQLLHQAGVPVAALQLLPGRGAVVGNAITSDPKVAGVVFTGSTQTALGIRRVMADNLAPSAPLIAETGGLNAMIVDSTALPEQAVRDVVASAFQSAGQRCSALRCLYVQSDIADSFLTMLTGAMDELALGDPRDLSTDVGPVIDARAYQGIASYLEQASEEGRILHQLDVPDGGWFIPPSLLRVDGIEDLEREIFGPVLHVATFEGDQIDDVVAAVNAKGYGLTFGLHTRIDSRVQEIADKVHVGNLYVNRNQIGAIVGSQPFGGEGLSGTGPKAGGPNYVPRFLLGQDGRGGAFEHAADFDPLQMKIEGAGVHTAISHITLPGPTGESNRLSLSPRGPILCLGPGQAAVQEQVVAVRALGGVAVAVEGSVAPEMLERLQGIHGVIWWGEGGRNYAQALARREGAIVPLIAGLPDQAHVAHERHLCIDTTAAGGNAALLGG